MRVCVDKDKEVYDDDNLMTFAEFLSGVARIGMWKYHQTAGSLLVKIAKAVEVCVCLHVALVISLFLSF